MNKRLGLRPRVAGLITFVAIVAAALFIVPSAFANTPVSGAVFTTVNPDVDGTGNCLNGGPGADAGLVDCNIYTGKEFVWLSGGPDGHQAALADGTYFFAVLAPGGQGGNQDPNDGTDKNLSDLDPTSNTGAGDTWTNRVFTVSDGVISYTGNTTETAHDFSNNKIRLMPYDDTTNAGGVYILAVCNLADVPVSGDATYPPGVDPSDCKYDAFKVRPAIPCTEDCMTGVAADPAITKDAAGAYNTTYTWGITKSACAHGVSPCTQTVDALSGSVTFDYTVKVTNDGGTNSGIKVTGNITVTNPNGAAVTIDGVTDQLSTLQNCTVTNGGPQTIAALSSTPAPPDVGAITYVCNISGTTVPTGLFNTAAVSWSGQVLSNGDALVGNSASYTFPTAIAFTQTEFGKCITVTDAFNGGSPGTLGNVCADGTSTGLSANPAVTASYTAPTWTLTYSRTVSVVPNACKPYGNSATFSGAGITTLLKGTDTAIVTVCGPATGGLTMGFWQNKNGQGIITGGAAVSTVCKSGTWLRQYAPFQDLSATATCAQVATYVTNVIKAANASGAAMNAMLKAQMLATALDVYFSDPALGGNKINAPTPVGGLKIDLTKICKMIDGSGGTATCSGTYQIVSAAFGGATALKVSDILAYAASQSNLGGSVWYAQVKATQELAKNTFDAINNQVAFIAP
jgi:hypothetical protein